MIWFTSDWHLFHVNILKYQSNRGVWSLEGMQELLTENYNIRVQTDDTVYFLGDVVMGHKIINIPLSIPFLNGHKHLILGNHDGGFENNDESDKFKLKTQFYLDNGFESVSRHSSLSPNLRLSHFPWRGVPDRENGREDLQKYALDDDGVSILLHGHSHQPEKVSGVRSIHVGVDAWDMKPVSMDQVADLILENGWNAPNTP